MADRNRYQPIQLLPLVQNGSGRTPTIETHYNECATAQSAFMIALQSYIGKAREEIKHRKEVFTKKMTEGEETKKEYERDIQDYAAKEVKMIEQVRKEREEATESEANVVSLEKQHTNLKDELIRKDAEIEEIKKEIFLRRGALSRDKEVLDDFGRRTAREAKALQDALGWTIEGVQKNVLLFRFTRIDANDPEKEFSIVLDVSAPNYKVTSSTPLLGTLPTLLDELNETRQFYVFVRKLRKAFRAHVDDSRR